MEASIPEAVKLLREGKTILYPADTIWGLGCDATNEQAVAKIFGIKQRPAAKSLIVLVSSDAMLERYVRKVPDVAWDLIDCATTPLTIVYPQAANLAPNAVADDGTVAIRVVKEGLCHQLIRQFNKPLISTSANLSGEAVPGSFAEISPEIITAVDIIVGKGSEPPAGRPSSIIKLGPGGEIEILRK